MKPGDEVFSNYLNEVVTFLGWFTHPDFGIELAKIQTSSGEVKECHPDAFKTFPPNHFRPLYWW